MTEALGEHLREIIQIHQGSAGNDPTGVCADLMDRGIVISGGGALLRNIDELITKSPGVPARIAEDPCSVARGTAIVLENLETYKRNVIAKR